MDRIILTKTTEQDYEDYYLIRSCPGDVYWNGYTSAPDKEKFRESYLSRLSNARFERPEDRRNFFIHLVGSDGSEHNVGFLQLIYREDGIDISYTIIEQFQRRGYASKALLLGIQMAKEFSDKIYVQIRDDNIASQGVALKCGFKYTEEYEIKDYPHVGFVKLRKYRLL